jgi:hypothetical protein
LDKTTDDSSQCERWDVIHSDSDCNATRDESGIGTSFQESGLYEGSDGEEGTKGHGESPGVGWKTVAVHQATAVDPNVRGWNLEKLAGNFVYVIIDFIDNGSYDGAKGGANELTVELSLGGGT